MHTLISISSATVVGLSTTYLTSPTIDSLSTDAQATWLVYQALVMDMLFACLLAFLILCHLEPRWVAANRSFPYTSHVENNFGIRAFDFQLLVYELWHSSIINSVTHTFCFFFEQPLWLGVVAHTFGLPSLALLNMALFFQACTYGDPYMAIIITALNSLYSAVVIWVFQNLPTLLVLNYYKAALLWLIVLQTATHADEPLPPDWNKQLNTFAATWSDKAYNMLWRDLYGALWLFTLGLASEAGAGMPGRLYNVLVFRVLDQMGYISNSIDGVSSARGSAVIALREGWHSNDMLAPCFATMSLESTVDLNKQ